MFASMCCCFFSTRNQLHKVKLIPILHGRTLDSFSIQELRLNKRIRKKCISDIPLCKCAKSNGEHRPTKCPYSSLVYADQAMLLTLNCNINSMTEHVMSGNASQRARCWLPKYIK